MEIKKQIQNDVKEFLKSGDELSLGTLRMVLASSISKEKEKRFKISKDLPALATPKALQAGKPDFDEEELIKKSQLTDEEMIGVLSSEIKKRKDAIVLYKQGNRPELADKEEKEIEILKKYLPEQIPAEELRRIIEESIAKVKIEIKDPSTSSGQVMGKVMADLMPKVKGKADNSEISKIIKELLSK